MRQREKESEKEKKTAREGARERRREIKAAITLFLSLGKPRDGSPNFLKDGWVHRLPGEHVAPGCTMGRRQADRGSVMLWAIFCWETLGPAIHVLQTEMTKHFSLLLAILVIAITTLNTEEELKETGFGYPPPRHGLALLKWYVKNCIDNNMVALCNPVAGEFGFHVFHNTGFLLPPLKDKWTYTYFTIGNLHYRHSEDLPYEVRKYYDPHNQQSNMDRVIVKLNMNKNTIEEIYITEHYNPPRTFHLGTSLIDDLRWNQNSTQKVFPKISQNFFT